jgi:hypothetical protein
MTTPYASATSDIITAVETGIEHQRDGASP